MLSNKLFVLLTLAVLAGCSSEKGTAPENTDGSPNGGIVAGTLQISAKESMLGLKNQTEQKLGYVVIGMNVAIIASVPPCTNCAELKQGESVSIPYASIAGYQPGMPTARVYWWKWVSGANGPEVSGFTQVSVELK